MRRQGTHGANALLDVNTPPSSEDEYNDYDNKGHRTYIPQSTINLLTPLFFLGATTASAASYYSTLEGGKTEQWLHAKLYGMAMWMVISDVFFLIAILLALNMQGRWRKAALGYAITSALCMFALDQGNTVQHHGAYNSLAFIVFLTPMLILGLVWRTCYFRFSCQKLMLINFAIIGLMLSIFATRVAYVRNDWNMGLLGFKFENGDEYGCRVEPPTVNAMGILPYRAWNFWAGSHKCTPMVIKGTLDNNGLLTMDCNSNPQYTVLPAVDKWPLQQKLYDAFQKKILAEAKTYNYTEPVIIDAEAVMIECGTNKNVLVRSIEKPETVTRVKEYNEANPKGEDKLNIVFLNFDAVARSHFHRRFIKSKKFIEKLHDSEEVEFFEFFRYHVLEVYTFPNLIAMYNGVNFANATQPLLSTIWDDFYDRGYVSASVDNSCLDWSGKYQKKRVAKVDHQFVAPFCLPEVHPLHNPYGNFAGPFSILRRCLAGDYVHKYSFQYLTQFIHQYQNLPKFILAAFNEGHEGTGEVIGLVDDDLVEFLGEIDYNNTAVFIVSDHGLHMNIMFAFREQSVLKENALGLLTAMFPKWFLNKHPEIQANLRHNRQALVTPYEIYETLQQLSNFPNKLQPREKTSLSLFDKVPYSRTCGEAYIPPHFCICNRDKL